MIVGCMFDWELLGCVLVLVWLVSYELFVIVGIVLFG